MLDNIREIEEMEKEIIAMIDNNIERYLKANPHSNLGNYGYSGKLSDDLFYKILYYSNEKAEKNEEQIDDWFEKGNNVAIVTGYMGCGKTTFINHYLWKKKKQEKKIILFDLEKINKNTELDIFVNKFGMQLYEMFKVKDKNFRSVLKNLYDRNFDFFDMYEDDDKLDTFISNYCTESTCENVRKQNAENKSRILKLDIESMFSLLILFVLCEQIIEKKSQEYLICFDNLDVAYEGKSLEKFYAGFLNSIANWEQGLPQFSYPEETITNHELYNELKFLFCMRETSKAKVTAYFKKKITSFVKPFDITEIYDKAEIIGKRVDLLERHKEDVEREVLLNGEIINEILNDHYIKLNIFPLFNHDYRSCIGNIVSLCCDEENKDMINDYLKLNNANIRPKVIKYAKYGARGILFRLIFDSFKSEGYFDKISIFDLENTTHKEQFSIPRMILTYVSNVQTNNGRVTPGIGVNNTPVALNRIYEAFEGIISPDLITECIINMYDLRNTNWNHLITFDTLRGDDVEHIRKELKNYKSKLSNYEYSKVLITCSGTVYLSTMATHFEFFACRTWGSIGNPLFLSANSLRDETGRFGFEDIVEKIFIHVKECCARIKNFDMEKFLSKYDCADKYANYLDSEYVYKDRKEKTGRIVKQFHGEKIIHTHISYLDAYRLYLLNSDEIEEVLKPVVSRTIIGYIQRYIDIFDNKKVVYSDQSLRIVENYQKAIQKIEGTNYTDRETEISLEAGLAL